MPVLEALAYHPRWSCWASPAPANRRLSAYLALSLAEAGLGDGAALSAAATLGRTAHCSVRVILREFAATLPADLKQGRAAQLWQFIHDELIDCGLPARTGTILQEVAANSGALFIFDGLDEAGDEARRALVLEAVTEFMRGAGDSAASC